MNLVKPFTVYLDGLLATESMTFRLQSRLNVNVIRQCEADTY